VALETLEKILKRAKDNDFIAISDLMTGIENGKFSREKVSQHVFKYSNDAVKIGITGPPGSGKSSLVNMLIPHLRNQGVSVGVIAIDPSSPITGGSFLGDRVRIKNAIDDKDVFVRSMGSRAELGGITELAEDFSDILAFTGKDIIFIETVGIGQSEYSVSEITDLTMLVFVPESGDEIQLLKAGILELADIFIINKYDRDDSSLMVKSIKNVISSTKKDSSDKQIFKTSCKTGDGIKDLGDALIQSHSSISKNESVKFRRKERLVRRVRRMVESRILYDKRIEIENEIEEIINKENE